MSETQRLDLIAAMAENPLVPVLTIQRVADAVPLARALVAAGLRLLEITLRTEAAPAAAAAIMAEVPDALVGFGTVVTPTDLGLAIRLGARFALSPGATPGLLRAAAESGLPYAPGVATAGEVMLAAEHGFTLVKFFPAESSGGPAAVKSLGGPLSATRFCPTGGIGENRVADYLALPNVVAVGCSWLASDAELKAGAFDLIRDRAARSLAAARAVKSRR